MIENEKYLIYEDWIGPADDQLIVIGIAYTPIIKKVLRKKDQKVFKIGEKVKIETELRKHWYPKQWIISNFEVLNPFSIDPIDDVRVNFKIKDKKITTWFPLSDLIKIYELKYFI